MADPVTLSIGALTAVSAGSSLLGGVMGYKSGQVQARAYELQGQTAARVGEIQSQAADLQAQGVELQARGTSEGYEYEAKKAEKAVELGRIAADQTDAALRAELRTSLGTMRAIRVAAGADPNSPTGQALTEAVAEKSEAARHTKMVNALNQIGLDENSINYFRHAAKMALVAGDIGATGTRLGGLGARIAAQGQVAGSGLAAEGAQLGAYGSLLKGLGSAAQSFLPSGQFGRVTTTG